MPELTASEQRLISQAVTQALTEVDSPTLTMGSAASVDSAVNPKDLFCEYWDTVKTVLEFLKGHLPIWLQPIVAMIIRIGDAVHAAICGK